MAWTGWPKSLLSPIVWFRWQCHTSVGTCNFKLGKCERIGDFMAVPMCANNESHLV